MTSHIPDAVPVEQIVVRDDNGDEVANFLGALTYTKTRARLYDIDTGLISEEFYTTGYMFSLPEGRAVRVDINVDVNKGLIKPASQFRDAMCVGPQTGD